MVRRLPEASWRKQKARHALEIGPWLEAHAKRRAAGSKHPVYDFMFEYYRHRPARLKEWSPGVDVLLEGAKRDDVFGHCAWRFNEEGALVDASAFPLHRRESLLWVVSLLEVIQKRAPFFGCFGLHEWAMVYGCESRRHKDFPLRLTSDEIDELVCSRELCCTHFDAYRFFTSAARPLNKWCPTADRRIELEQPGCLHVIMDTYKWATKFHPWVSSRTQLDALWLAVQARELDMRASPYDLRQLGFEPICVETSQGREQYVQLQKELSCRAFEVRGRLLAELRAVVRAWNSHCVGDANVVAQN